MKNQNLEKMFAAGWQKSIQAGSVRPPADVGNVGKPKARRGEFSVWVIEGNKRYRHVHNWRKAFVGKTVMVNGKKKLHYTAFDMSTTPPTLVRRDHALDVLRKLGAKLPPIYCDELGHMRGEDDEIIFKGPDTRGENKP